MRPLRLALRLLSLIAGCAHSTNREISNTDTRQVSSPDGKITVDVTTGDTLTYAVRVEGKPLLAPSQLGLQLKSGLTLGPRAHADKTTVSDVGSTWENPLGKRRLVQDRYRQLTLSLREPTGEQFTLQVRAYNDGVAVRYLLPETLSPSPVTVTRELTQFAFPRDATCYAGSQLNGFAGPQEWEFWPTTLSALPSDRPTGLPLLAKTDAAWVAVTEADLLDYAGMWVTNSPTPPLPNPNAAKHTAQTPVPAASQPTASPVSLYTHLAPRADGDGLAKLSLPARTPWRVLMIARQPGRLIESDLISNLATPSKIADPSWIKPGMMAWDHWWHGDVKMDTATLKDYIQLASDMGWPYQLIDWQWYGPYNKPEADITHINPAVDMDEVRRFASEKGVRLWLWLHYADVDRHGEYQKAFPLYESWGIAGVKIDFMDADHQEMVNWYAKIAKAAADHHLMVNFHGAYKPTGMSRTYPNQVTREGILGNEYNRWSKRVTPTHKLTLPFTRYLAGPADFTPGGFLNRQPAQFVADRKAAEVQGTRAAELALFVAYDSPVMCACDHPDNYKGQPGTDFLKIVPTVWDDTKVLEGDVGHRLVIARRHAGEWYLAALTNEEPADVTVRTDFLPAGKWQARLWLDADDAAANGQHLTIKEQTLSTGDRLHLKLAPAGGAVVHLTPVKN